MWNVHHTLWRCFVCTGPALRIGAGLEKKTADCYRREWELYLKFCRRARIKPVSGIDKPCLISIRFGKIPVVASASHQRYSSTNQKGRGSSDFAVTASHDHESDRQKKKGGNESSWKIDSGQTLALGHVAVGMLFSAYGATTQKGFSKLSDCLTRCPCMHSETMRYGLLQDHYCNKCKMVILTMCMSIR